MSDPLENRRFRIATGASKTGKADAIYSRTSLEVSFNISEAGPGVHASVPTGPIVDGRGCGGGAFTSVSAAKAGVPINAMATIAVASFFTAPPEASILRSENGVRRCSRDVPQIFGLCCSVATS
jgi:hypothetical protein